MEVLTLEFELKLGHRTFTITDKDRVYRNTVDSFSVPTQTYWSHHSRGFQKLSANIAKAKALKWVKQGILQEVRTTKDFVIYKFTRNPNE